MNDNALMDPNDNYEIEYGTLMHFFKYKEQRGYIFAIADDQRMIPQINASLMRDLAALGKKLAILYLQPQTDEPLFYQISKAAEGHDALVIANIYAIADGTTAGNDSLITLNFAREAFWELGIPVLFWCAQGTMPMISRYAPDLFSQRRMSTVHFTDKMDAHVAEQIKGPDREAYITTDKFKELEGDVQLLEKRLKGAREAGYHPIRTLREIALPLAAKYAELGMKEQAQNLLTDYSANLDTVDDNDVLAQLATIYELLQEYELAITTLHKADSHLAQRPANDLAANQQKAQIQNSLGDVYYTIGGLEKALIHYQQFNLLQKEICEAIPNNLLEKYDQSVAYSKIGRIYERMGAFTEALEYYEKDHELAKSVHASNPRDVFFTNGLAISYSKLGGVYEQIGDFAKAIEYYEKQTDLFKQIHESNPRDISLTHGFAISHEKLGSVYERMGDFTKALEHYELRNTLGKQLQEANPRDVSFTNGLAISYGKLGSVYEQMGDFAKALEYFGFYNNLQKQLHESNPDDVSFTNSVAASYGKLGSVYEEMGDFAKALEYYELWNVLAEQLHESNPRDVAFKNGLAVSHAKLGWLLQKNDSRATSKSFLLQAKALWEAILIHAPEMYDVAHNLAIVNSQLAALSA